MITESSIERRTKQTFTQTHSMPHGVQQFSTLPVFMTANYNQIQKPSTRLPIRRPRSKPRMQRKGAGLSRPRVVTKSAFSQKRKLLRRKTTSPRKSSFNTNTFCGFLDQQLNRPPTPSFSFLSVPNQGNGGNGGNGNGGGNGGNSPQSVHQTPKSEPHNSPQLSHSQHLPHQHAAHQSHLPHQQHPQMPQHSQHPQHAPPHHDPMLSGLYGANPHAVGHGSPYSPHMAQNYPPHDMYLAQGQQTLPPMSLGQHLPHRGVDPSEGRDRHLQ